MEFVFTKDVEVVYAFCAIEKNGDEGIISIFSNGMWHPCILTSKNKMIREMWTFCVGQCAKHGKQLKVYKFSNKVDVTEELKQGNF